MARKKRRTQRRRSAAQRRATARMLAANKARGRGSSRASRKSSRRRASTRSSRRVQPMAKKKRRSSRKSSRRFSGRGGGGGGRGMLGGLFNPGVLMQGAGVAAGAFGTNFLIDRLPIPQIKTGWGRVVGQVIVGMIGGALLRRASPTFATSFALGGVAAGVTSAIQAVRPSTGPARITARPALRGLMGTGNPSSGGMDEPLSALGQDGNVVVGSDGAMYEVVG